MDGFPDENFFQHVTPTLMGECSHYGSGCTDFLFFAETKS